MTARQGRALGPTPIAVNRWSGQQDTQESTIRPPLGPGSSWANQRHLPKTQPQRNQRFRQTSAKQFANRGIAANINFAYLERWQSG